MAMICLNELSNYNNGELVYKWFDLEDFMCASDFWGAVDDWMKTCTSPNGEQCEEWNIADVEGIPDRLYGGYSFEAEKYFHYRAICEEVGKDKVDAYDDLFGYYPDTASEVNEVFFSNTDHFDDESRAFHIEIGVALVELSGMLDEVPEEVSRYFDYAKYGRDHYNERMGMSNGLIFWTE